MFVKGWAAAFVAGGLVLGCGAAHETAPGADPSPSSLATRDDPIAAIESPSHLDARRLALGEKLFADPILSGDGKVACTSCHHSDLGGADGKERSKLESRAKATAYNAPSIFNVAY